MRVQGRPRVLQGLHIFRDMLGGIDGAQAGEDVQVVLAETHTIVFEVGRTVVIVMATKDAVFLGHAHHPLHAGQTRHVLKLQRGRVAYEIDLGQCLLCAYFVVYPGRDVRQVGQMFRASAGRRYRSCRCPHEESES